MQNALNNHVQRIKTQIKLRNVPFVKTSLGLLVASSLMLSACQSSPFAKAPVPEPLYIPDLSVGAEQRITILPVKQPCDSPLPMLCMIAKTQSGEFFEIPYSWIEGFDHTNGIEYVIDVKPEIDQNNNSMTGKWQLQSIVSQQAVPN